ncbi:enterotoxin [Virgibacillus dokdonensis]|uniref:Enterotoxin n=1 Tax=Virgibacillus dokdonensis TaxID=302167 RepID=A0A3E0WX31_9BACI|nr:HBL/NHE enterotoxin family protein [Virgibacillus dokdonensis]RFA36576.1 enterotoxin [Virgibacillus dokdonensis]
MSTKPLKTFVQATVVATLLFSSVAPSYASATVAENHQPNNIHELADNYKKYDLGPEGLRKALEATGSNALVMDLYALTVLKQPDINFSKVTIIDKGLQSKILTDQSIARENAKVWLDNLKPQLIKTNQNIINYDNRFEGYYDKLLQAAENRDKSALAARIKRLTRSVTKNKKEVDQLIVDLKDFRQKLQSDTQNLKKDTNQLTSILTSHDAGIPLLKQQIESYHDAISKYNSVLIASSVATSLGPIAIAGGIAVIATGAGTPLGVALIAGGTAATGGGITGIVLAKEGIDDAEAEIKSITKEVTDAEIQLALATGIKQQTSHLTETIDLAIDSLQNISTQWSTMDAKYRNLLSDIDFMSPSDLDLIKEDLEIAKMSWGNIRDYAQKLYVEEIKVVDNQ